MEKISSIKTKICINLLCSLVFYWKILYSPIIENENKQRANKITRRKYETKINLWKSRNWKNKLLL